MQGLVTWGKGIQVRKTVPVKALEWGVPVFPKSGHTVRVPEVKYTLPVPSPKATLLS